VKIADVIAQLRAVVPQHTSLFTDAAPAVLTFVADVPGPGGLVTGDTSPDPHNLSPGQVVTISAARNPYAVGSLTFDSATGLVTGVTTNDHDLTEGWQSEIEIVGADQAEYNGTWPLVSTDNRRTFVYGPIAGSPAAATGTIKMVDPLGTSFIGSFQVNTTPTATTFTYQIASNPESAGGVNAVLHLAPRISGAITEDRLAEAYTKRDTDEYFAFVVMGDVTTSRDRAIETDANQQIADDTHKRLRQIEPFSVYVFARTSQEMSARAVRDSMDDVKQALLKALFGVKLPTVFSDSVWCTISPTGDGFAAYNSAVYVHRFDFERSIDLVEADAVEPGFTRAWRDTNIQQLNDFDETIMETDINMDRVAL